MKLIVVDEDSGVSAVVTDGIEQYPLSLSKPLSRQVLLEMIEDAVASVNAETEDSKMDALTRSVLNLITKTGQMDAFKANCEACPKKDNCREYKDMLEFLTPVNAVNTDRKDNVVHFPDRG